MEKIEYRAVIRYLYLKGKTPKQIKTELDAVYGDAAPSLTTVKFWVAEFKRGRTSLDDDERMGRPKTATTEDNISRVHQMVLDNRQIKVREIAETMHMSKERVCWILKEDLGMRKLTARWIDENDVKSSVKRKGDASSSSTSADIAKLNSEVQFEVGNSTVTSSNGNSSSKPVLSRENWGKTVDELL